MNIRPDQLYALLHGEHWTGMTLFLLLILSTHRTSVHYIITYPIHACISYHCISYMWLICQVREKMCRTPSGSERKRKRLGVSDGDNGKCWLLVPHWSLTFQLYSLHSLIMLLQYVSTQL